MIYIYDLTLNFNDRLYDFYDWKDTDSITHYRKIPLIKLSDKKYDKFLNNKVVVDEELLSLVRDKAQQYKGRMLKTVKYAFVLTNGFDAFAVMLDDGGTSVKKSKLVIGEELEVIDLANNLKVKDVSFNIVCKDNFVNKFTRDEEVIINDVVSKINDHKDNLELLKYLYYEWNNKIYVGKSCYDDLIKDITSQYSDKLNKLNEILNLYVKNV